MSEHVVVARIAGLAGRLPELRQLLADRAVAARAEPGCAGYEVGELVGEPAAFVVVQTWSSAEAMRAHYASAAHASYQHARRRAAGAPDRGARARGGVDDAPGREHVADGSRALRLTPPGRPPATMPGMAGASPLPSLRRALVALAGAAVAGGLAYAAVVLGSGHVDDRGSVAALGLVVGWSFIGDGPVRVVAAAGQPHRRAHGRGRVRVVRDRA